jgi:hypothetical protein
MEGIWFWIIVDVIVPLLLFLYLRNELKEDTSERVRNRVNFVMGFGIFSLIIQILSSLMYAFLILFSLEGTLYRFVEKCVNVSMYCIWATFFLSCLWSFILLEMMKRIVRRKKKGISLLFF